ncbi:MAG: CoA-binding protein [Bdellovibrionales bacterium]|nr:CoA-binding protein [Bdellovibrionales bacterium]
MKVLVFGYSDNPDRYSYMASELLKEHHHEVTMVNPRIETEFSKLEVGFHTLTLYVNPSVGEKFQDQLLKLKPKRVIFNPGTENPVLMRKFETLGVEVVVGCTLVMLRTNQFN